MTRITVLGLGAMGSRMAKRLIASGHLVTVWNRNSHASEGLRDRGASVASRPMDAVKDAEIVISMVFDDEASRSIWLDEQTGALRSLSSTALAIESSTLTPACVNELHNAMRERGIAFVDAPVAGSRAQADAGQLIYMVGGEPDAVDRASPVLRQMGCAVHHIGPVGSGAWLKLVVNALFGTQVAGMAEQLALLKAAGVDLERALTALKTMPVISGAAAGAATLMLARDFAPQAPIDLIAKDLSYALRSAQQTGTVLPITAAVVERFLAASAAGYGRDNVVAVARLHG